MSAVHLTLRFVFLLFLFMFPRRHPKQVLDRHGRRDSSYQGRKPTGRAGEEVHVEGDCEQDRVPRPIAQGGGAPLWPRVGVHIVDPPEEADVGLAVDLGDDGRPGRAVATDAVQWQGGWESVQDDGVEAAETRRQWSMS